MIIYFDSSALVKKYFKEIGSASVVSIWKKAAEVFTSAVTYAEIMASFYRKKKEVALDESIFKGIVRSFRRDWESFFCIDVADWLHPSIDRLIATYMLRGFDAIHLASALTIYERMPHELVFACFDQQLAKAAQKEGIKVLSSGIRDMVSE